ncbi:beta-N-acetylglucosaminidase domain-containing protein [Limnofasciculus baicalensis]|uniref:Protein O-GlcNAcase n=1 Tax=Limnofasciculus baicalensis BBK-W-15 TaxID=2699891 RepID=A0AAE3GSU6_9CYAN|nr:beta-N-acetylglucosaminidase domain-containing protein [Limnofasciculus baicalensis]MCP2730130.1 protein O-GlcNAcase [Limnofasciculus baicalensis BBK-W-15]
MTKFNPGVIEGFFGKPWDWEMRCKYAHFLKNIDYGFYIYAPKADDKLRRNWRQDWSDDDLKQLIYLGHVYHQAGIKWGIGFSPFEIYLNYDSQAIKDLEKKIHYFNHLNLDILAVLFDDMRGDSSEISKIQVDIVHRIADLSNAETFIMCPTYYTDDPILDKLFGERPANYLQTLGNKLDPEINVFWTGSQVCSKSYPESHLKEVGEKLGRLPFIWDNYPVNDGAKLSLYLHLKAFDNRPYQMSELVSGHAVNPMNQAHLSQIPLMTLTMSYQRQNYYSPSDAFVEAVERLCSPELADALVEDISLFQDRGLEQLSPNIRQSLIKKYEAFDSPYSLEIVGWLKEEYLFSPECLTG